jgi:putative protein kinase ArgK-like GTPase of G3E family
MSLADVPFIVAISKHDEPHGHDRLQNLNEEISNFYNTNEDILYYPKAIATSAKDLSGFQVINYLLRHMLESSTNCKTDDLYW